MKYEAICYSLIGREVVTMSELGPWLVRAVAQLPGIERIEIGRMLDAEDLAVSTATNQEQFNGEAFDVVFLPRRSMALAIARGIHDADTDNADENDLRHYAEQGCLLADAVVSAEKSGAKVFVVAIDHKYGMDSSVFITRAAAEHYLFGYVAEWWDKDGPKGEAMPTDQAEAIDRYFHHDDSRDSYTLNECEVRS